MAVVFCRNVVHRDIKLENILTNKAGDHIVLGDFGLSHFLGPDKLLRTHCGSPEYSAPEVILSSKKYTKEVDIWSCGVTLYVMVTGELPFVGHRTELMSQIREGLTERHYSMLAGLSESVRSLLHQILCVGVDVNQRPRLHEIQLFSWCFSLPAPRPSSLSHQQQLQVAKRLKDKLGLVKWSPDKILGYVQSNRGKLGKTAGCFSLMAADLRQQEVTAQPLRSPASRPAPAATVIKPLPVPLLEDHGRGRLLTSNAARPEDFINDERSARKSGGQENKPSTKTMKTLVPRTQENTQTPVRMSDLGHTAKLRTASHSDKLVIFAQHGQEPVKEGSVRSRNIKKRRRSSSNFGHFGHHHHGVNKSRANPPGSGETKPFKYLDKTSQF